MKPHHDIAGARNDILRGLRTRRAAQRQQSEQRRDRAAAAIPPRHFLANLVQIRALSLTQERHFQIADMRSAHRGAGSAQRLLLRDAVNAASPAT